MQFIPWDMKGVVFDEVLKQKRNNVEKKCHNLE